MDILLIIGIAIFFGTVGGKILQRFKIPQVVGYILIGVIIGKSFLHIFEQATIDSLTPVVNFTLGIIGFIIGAELKSEVFKKYGRAIYTILFSQGLITFIAVAACTTLITKQLHLGLLLGAVATATDPASTANVLWEYKAKGPLTTTVMSVVALDDALALIIYGFANVFAKAMISKEGFTLGHSIGVPILEIAQSVLLGVVAGKILSNLIIRIKEKELTISFILGTIAIVVGLSMYLHLDLILSSMFLGMTISNIIPKRSERFFDLVKEMSTSLYILFFVVIGAQLDVRIFLKFTVFGIILAFLLARSLGKIYGAMFGAFIARSKREVTRYIGFCILPQGGVAMGLALSISHNLAYLGEEGRQIGLLVVNIAAATTFVIQLVGPSLVKWAITQADETNRDITKDDIIESHAVADVMQRNFSVIKENAALKEIISSVREKEGYHFPVVNKDNKLIGSISIGELKEALLNKELGPIMLAGDIAAPHHNTVYANQPLKEAFEIFDIGNIDYLPVLKDKDSQEVVGILEYRPLMDIINRKVLERQNKVNGQGEKEQTTPWSDPPTINPI